MLHGCTHAKFIIKYRRGLESWQVKATKNHLDYLARGKTPKHQLLMPSQILIAGVKKIY